MGDIRTKFPRSPIHTPDPTARTTNAYYKPREQDSTPEDCILFRGWDSAVDDDSKSESGVCSPTLWGSNSRSSPQFHRTRNRTLSPTSRTLAIARGQQELMEMVRNMPESSYELSLKDLVEHRLSNSQRQHEGGSVEKYDSGSETSFSRDPSWKRSEARALVTRSRSVNSSGFYLKMFFPMPFGKISTKKKRNLKSDSGLNGSSRVSLKPPQVDRDWWGKRSSAAERENEGSISGGSTNSNSTSSERSNNSRNSESQGSCWFCISPIRSKIPE